MGDFRAAEIESLPDPCPTPEMDKKRRTLSQKERFVYAPMSGVGGVLYDKDAVYIDIGGSHHMKEEENEVNIVHISITTTKYLKIKSNKVNKACSYVSLQRHILFNHIVALPFNLSTKSKIYIYIVPNIVPNIIYPI